MADIGRAVGDNHRDRVNVETGDVVLLAKRRANNVPFCPAINENSGRVAVDRADKREQSFGILALASEQLEVDGFAAAATVCALAKCRCGGVWRGDMEWRDWVGRRGREDQGSGCDLGQSNWSNIFILATQLCAQIAPSRVQGLSAW